METPLEKGLAPIFTRAVCALARAPVRTRPYGWQRATTSTAKRAYPYNYALGLIQSEINVKKYIMLIEIKIKSNYE